MCPCRAFHECFFFVLVFFSLEMWDPLRPEYSKKYKNSNICRKKQEKKTIRKRVGGGTLNTRVKFQGISLKNGVDIGL